MELFQQRMNIHEELIVMSSDTPTDACSPSSCCHGDQLMPPSGETESAQLNLMMIHTIKDQRRGFFSNFIYLRGKMQIQNNY